MRTRGLKHRAGCTIAAILTVATVTGAFAVRPASATPSAAASRYASIVMDADSGEVLYERNADLPRYPASLTKIMTLYMAFEALAKKKIALTDELTISTHAATRDPSRLNLAPGSKLKVEDAIRAMTTKSANDAACAVAEALGKGSEATFADRMTAKAKTLGLKQTTFHNASGLPEDGHVTSARDLAILCKALVHDYPTYYTYFSTSAFEFHGTRYPNQNRFLRTYYGADGIKTGFVNASGHNLAASAVRGGKRLIAIVLGGDTQGWTREHATRLLDVSYAKIDPSMVMVASNATGPAPAAATPAEAAVAASAARASASAAATSISSAPSPANVYPTPAGAVMIASDSGATLPLPNATANLKAYASAGPAPAPAKGPSREAALQLASIERQAAAAQTPPKPAPTPTPTPTPPPKPPDPGAPPGHASAQAQAQAPTPAPTPTPPPAPKPPDPGAPPGRALAQAPSPAPNPAPAPKPTPPDPNAPPGRSAAPLVTASAQAPAPTPKPEPPTPDPKPKPSPPGAASSSVETVPASDEADSPETLASPRTPPVAGASAPVAAGVAKPGAAGAATPVATGDWSVQVGLFRDATVARRRGEEARNQMPLQLRGADLVVARAQDGVHVTSRIGRLSEEDAREACTQLQRGRFPCVVVPPGRPMIVATN